MRIHVYFALNQSQTMNCSIGIGLCFMYLFRVIFTVEFIGHS